MPTKRPKGIQPGPTFSCFFGPVDNLNLHRTGSRRSLAVTRRPRAILKIHADESEPTPKCPCKAFKYLDRYWQLNQNTLRPIWNAALKKKHMSGYELFMKESLTLCPITGTLPECPSVSGGYAKDKLIPSTNEIPPLGDWIGKACLTACESACESECETTCQASCETACQTSCETSCQAACETSCETQAEVGYGTGCAHCTGNNTIRRDVTIAGCTGSAATLNGTYITKQILACEWRTVPAGYPLTGVKLFPSPGPNIYHQAVRWTSSVNYVLWSSLKAKTSCMATHVLPYASNRGFTLSEISSSTATVIPYPPT